jgi:hypothetical protein
MHNSFYVIQIGDILHHFFFHLQAAEYMQQLPPSKLPISGSDGALFRRQQLEKQLPLHDLDASKCHGLTPDEIQGLVVK